MKNSDAEEEKCDNKNNDDDDDYEDDDNDSNKSSSKIKIPLEDFVRELHLVSFLLFIDLLINFSCNTLG